MITRYINPYTGFKKLFGEEANKDLLNGIKFPF